MTPDLKLVHPNIAGSPFYDERLAAVGGWERLPPTRRAELVRDQCDHLPHGRRRRADASPPIRAGATGTGEDLLVLTYTAADLARERAAGCRLLRALGVEPGMRVANILRGALSTPGSLLLGDVVDELGGLDVPVGFPESAAAAAQAWRLIDRVQPQILIVDQPGGDLVWVGAPPQQRPWLAGIVWLSTLEAHDVAISLPDSFAFGGWQRRWLAVPEATSFVAGSCAQGSLHFDSDLIVEVVDVDGRVAAAGAGRLLLTPLGLDTPILRYDTGASVSVERTPCSCGHTGARMAAG